MKLSDLISMSMSSLFKRKLRTVLTILGVVIGIASIVIMVSLGLGLNKQSMDMIEQYGGLRTITVTEGHGSDGSGGYDSGESGAGDLKLKLDDDAFKKISSLEHVTIASPVLNFRCVLRSGNYVASVYSAYGYSLEALRDMKWQFSQGELPKEGEPLKFIYGNLMSFEFEDAHSGKTRWETGITPQIDYMKSPMFTIFDVDAYYQTQNSSEMSSPFDDDAANSDKKTVTPPKKYMISAAGVLYGESEEDWRDYSMNIYCDIEALKTQLKRVFRGKAIPGQPTKKNGSPYKKLYYSQIYLKIDKIENVADVQQTIRDMGYSADSNSEWIEQEKKSAQQQQTMLGGIGAVSLLVAAIGIANTMMMSIYERTKEIGIMKVLGCDMDDIRSLFLIEAALIGFCGGMIGDILSFAVSMIINAITKTTTSLVPPWLYMLGLAFAVFVGMAAGFFPSKRAMQLSPLAAIRNE